MTRSATASRPAGQPTRQGQGPDDGTSQAAGRGLISHEASSSGQHNASEPATSSRDGSSDRSAGLTFRTNRWEAARRWARFATSEIAEIAGVDESRVQALEQGQLANRTTRRAIGEALELAVRWRREELRREMQQESLRAIRTQDEERRRAKMLAAAVDHSDPHPAGRCRHNMLIDECAPCTGTERRAPVDNDAPSARGPRYLGPVRKTADGKPVRPDLRDNHRGPRQTVLAPFWASKHTEHREETSS